jgi:transcriptional regulator NrdR family protein
MKCPVCQANTTVLATRNTVMRSRECTQGHRFLTEEKFVQRLPSARPRADHLSATLEQRGAASA